MKKWLSLILCIVMITSCLAGTFSANAAVEKIITNGSEQSITVSADDEKELSISVAFQGRLSLTLSVTAPDIGIYLYREDDPEDYKELLYVDEALFGEEKIYSKDIFVYLTSGKYRLCFENGAQENAVSYRATWQDIRPATVVNFPANKQVQFFIGEWDLVSAVSRIIVKKDYRLNFTLSYNTAVGLVIIDEAEKVYLTRELIAYNEDEPQETELNVCLKKGTYYLGVINLAEDTQPGSGVVSMRMAVKPYIPVPTDFKVITRKTTSQTVSYKAQKGVAGYQVQCSYGGTQWAQTKTGTSLTCSFKGLTPGGKYKFRVRSYVIENGKKVYGARSKTLCSCAKPAETKLEKLSSSKGRIIVACSTQSQNELLGYQIFYATDASFKNVVKKVSTEVGQKEALNFSFGIGGFKSGKTYYVKVRRYNSFNGTNYCGAWSNVMKIKVK